MPAKDFAGTRFSALADITPQKAPSLHPVWTFSTGVLGGHEGQPLVVGGVMYVVTPWPNVLYAFDLSKEGYPLKWKYRPDVSPNAIGVSCCDTVNRGAFYADGKLFYNLLDGHTVAVDDATGMGVVEACGDLIEQVGDALIVQAHIHQVGQGRPADVLEDEVGHAAVVFAKIVNGDDVRVAHARGCARFTAETLHELARRGQVLRQNLHGDRSVETFLAGAIHHRHSAVPNGLEQRVTSESTRFHMRSAR